MTDALALLRASLDLDDRMAILAVLRGPATGLLDSTLMNLVSLAGRGPLLAVEHVAGLAQLATAEDECMRYARTVTALLEARDLAQRVKPSVLLHALVRAVSLDGVLVQLPDGAEQLANLRKLLRAAAEDSSVAHFVARMQGERDRATAEEEASAGADVASSVQLMTVHASKGLDFEAVYFLYSTRRSRGDAAGWTVARAPGLERATLFARWASENGPYAPLSMIDVAAESGRRRDDEDARKAYVAVTRARNALTLVGLAPTEKASKKSVKPCDEAALSVLASAGLVRIEDTSVEAEAQVRLEVSAAAMLPRVYSGTPTWNHMQIAPTALGDFQRCERLFQLRHVLSAEPFRGVFAPKITSQNATERAPSESKSPRSTTAFPQGDAAHQGVIMHRVLEHLPALEFGAPKRGTLEALLAREGVVPDDPAHAAMLGALLAFASGPFAASCLARGAVLHRELSFVLGVDGGSSRRLELRGTADLVAEYPDGSIEIVDYKRGAGPHAELHAFQLGVYTHAVRQRFPDAPSIRAGVAFLGEGKGEVQFLPPSDRAPDSDCEGAELLALADGLARARGLSQFSAQARPRCEQLHCPYLGTCWPAQAPGGG